MPITKTIEVVLLAYLMGSIPFGYLLVRFFKKEDIRAKGSGNIGATNVIRSGSKGLGALTFLLDTFKGYAAVWLGAFLVHQAQTTTPDIQRLTTNAIALAGISAILGHVYPIWLGFKGGKGVATAFGVFLALAPWAALAALVIFVFLLVASKYVSLSSIIAAAAFPFLVLWLNRTKNTSLFLTVVFVSAFLIVAKHHQNIRRLLNGTEYRFGRRKAEA
jgi:acyl phosphate:glycerol-3-phosphate acyltransferase